MHEIMPVRSTRLKFTLFHFLVFFFLSPLLFAEETVTMDSADCQPQDGMVFICGPANAEDMVWVPMKRWIITSGVALGEVPGRLYWIDPDNREYQTLFPSKNILTNPDASLFSGCLDAPTQEQFSPLGLSIKQITGQKSRLYAVNIGARRSIEVFDLDTGGTTLEITWVGCVPMPQDAFINSVVILDDGGFLVTRFSDFVDASNSDKAVTENLNGHIYEWRPGHEVKRLEGAGLARPNGILISEDGKTVYVASWGRSEIHRYTWEDAFTSNGMVKLGFRPDNLRWTQEGKIIAAGHRLAEGECRELMCIEKWFVAEVDPKNLTTRILISKKPIPEFSGATVALPDAKNNELWLGTIGGNRIAVIQN